MGWEGGNAELSKANWLLVGRFRVGREYKQESQPRRAQGGEWVAWRGEEYADNQSELRISQCNQDPTGRWVG